MTNQLSDLNYFTGTESYHRLTALAKFVCTDGVKYVADNAGAYWLIDAIASYQPQLSGEDFQFWKLVVTGTKAVLTCTDGNNETPLISQNIPYTDFPAPCIEFYLTDNVLMLLSEY